MPEGGCLCNGIRVSFSGDPGAVALCHCYDCRKISGSSHSTSFVIPASKFKVEKGTPKTYAKTAESGKKIISHFCPDCGTTLFRVGDWNPEAIGIKAGILDDPKLLDGNVPKAELYVQQRPGWIQPVKDAAQLPGMPTSAFGTTQLETPNTLITSDLR